MTDIALRIRQIPFNEILAAWDVLDDKGKDLGAIRALCKIDRYYLLVKVLNRVDVWHPWIYARCREVEAAPDGHIDIWAREHYKSTIITYAGIIQEILKDPEITVGIFSHTKPIAKAFLSQIKREFESNQTLRGLFTEIIWTNCEKEAPQWSLDGGIVLKRNSNPKEATVEAHGLVDGQPTSKHFKLMDFDDVVVPESVSTPEQITKTTEAWSLADNLGTVGGRKWHVGTRYHYADTYHEIIKRGAAKARIYPATHDGTISGRPVLFSQAEWDRRVRDQLESTIACQMLQNPLAGSQRMFNVEDLREYEVRPSVLMGYLLCDPARSTKRGSANTAMVVLGVDYAGNKYLLDGVAHKMDLMDRWRWMRDLRNKWSREPGMQGFQVGYERFGAIADLDYFKERMQVEKTAFDIAELEWPREGDGSKNDRVQRLVPDIRGHRFYGPYPTDEKNLTKTQRAISESGYEYRVSRKIKRKDENDVLYDVWDRFKLEVSFFPFGGLKDLVDAASRLYDLEPKTPEFVNQTDIEPEYV